MLKSKMSARGGSASGGKKIFNLEKLIYPHTHKAQCINTKQGKLRNVNHNLLKYHKCKFLSVGVYLTIILLPAYLVRFNIFGAPTNALEVLILIIFIGWIAGIKKASLKLVLTAIRKKYVLPMSLIFLGFIISTLTNGSYAAGFGIIKSWLFFPMLFVFLVSQILDKEKIINIYKALYLSAFLVSFISLVYLFLGHLTYDGRLEAFFNSPNYLAMYLAPALIIGFILAQNQKSKIKNQNDNLKIKNINLAISLLIIALALYFTLSYTTWISVILSLIIVSIIRNKTLVKNKAVIILVLLVASLFIIQLNSEKIANLKNYNRSSLESRMMIWKSAGRMLENKWVFGIGPGNFQEKYLEYQKYYPPYLEWAVPHPHSLFLAFWLYGGILGMVGFIILIFYFIRDIFGAIKKTGPMPIKFIALGIMLCILIHGLFDTTYFKNDLAVIFWLNFLAL